MPAGEMDALYSIGVNNRFIGIDNDSDIDPLELIRAAQEKPKKEKDVKPKGKKDVKPVKGNKERTVKIETPVDADANSDNRKTDRNNRPRGRGRGGRGRGSGEFRGRGGRGGRFGSATSPNNEQGGFDNNNSGGFNDNNNSSSYRGGFGKKEQSPVADTQSEGFGSGFGGGFGNNVDQDNDRRGGRSGFRGGRGGRGRGRGGRGGGREFDRRSGSDKSSVKAFEKRDGSGSYNWGTPQDELAASEEQHTGGFGTPKETEDSPAETTEQTTETEETTVEEKQEDAGPQEMTFEEYKKQQKDVRAKPQFNSRKVEGEKKGMKQLKKPTEEDNEADGSLFFPRKYVEEKYKSSGRVKEELHFDLYYSGGENRHFDQDRSRRGPRGRNNRGGRGGPRRDEAGGNMKQELALENTEEFPSL